MTPGVDPTNRMRWRILALLFVCRIGLGFQFQTLGSVADPLIARFGFSHAEIGALIGLFMLPGLVLALPAGYAARYLSDRSIVAFGLFALGVGGVVAAVAQGFGVLGAGRVVAGVGFVLSSIYMTKMIADWFTGKELATAMGALVMSWPFGIAMGQIVHVRLAASGDWRVAFLVAALYCAIGALAVFALYRAPHARADTGPMPAARACAGTTRAARLSGLPPSELLLTLIAAVVWALFNAGYIVYLSFAPQVLRAGGYDATDAMAVISLASWVMIVSGVVGGQVADRTGRRDQVLYLCLAVAVATLLLLPLTGLAVPLSLAFGLLGMAPAGVIMALTGEAMAPQRRAFGMSLFSCVTFVAMAAVPPIAGWLFDRLGYAYAPIVFAAVLFVACGLANVAFRRAQRRIRLGTGAATAA